MKTRVAQKFLITGMSLVSLVAPAALSANAFSMPQPILSASLFQQNLRTHQLKEVTQTGRFFQLEDGSRWEVSGWDKYTLSSWYRGDPLVITPNDNWFSSCTYCVTNKRNFTRVNADLTEFPDPFGPYSHWIVDIDYIGGHIYLENNMCWCVSPEDTYVLRTWSVNDHIIFGESDSLFSYYDAILINPNMDNYLKARQY